jgi:hypothetical protein
MTDSIATRDGYTRYIVLSNGPVELWLLIKPETDLDSAFRAWDTDNQEFIIVNGWLFALISEPE